MSWLRHPRTTQERRASLDGYCRPRRNIHNLPSAWEDIPRGDLYDRCWKRFRKTQYKAINKFSKPKKDSSKYALSMSKREHFFLDHKWCSYGWKRCKYCIKNKIWEAHDQYHERQHRRYLAESGWRMRLMWKNLE